MYLQCVDEWLRVNASCPTCRTSIFSGGNGPEDDIPGSEDAKTNEVSAADRDRGRGFFSVNFVGGPRSNSSAGVPGPSSVAGTRRM